MAPRGCGTKGPDRPGWMEYRCVVDRKDQLGWVTWQPEGMMGECGQNLS